MIIYEENKCRIIFYIDALQLLGIICKEQKWIPLSKITMTNEETGLTHEIHFYPNNIERDDCIIIYCTGNTFDNETTKQIKNRLLQKAPNEIFFSLFNFLIEFIGDLQNDKRLKNFTNVLLDKRKDEIEYDFNNNDLKNALIDLLFDKLLIGPRIITRYLKSEEITGKRKDFLPPMFKVYKILKANQKLFNKPIMKLIFFDVNYFTIDFAKQTKLNFPKELLIKKEHQHMISCVEIASSDTYTERKPENYIARISDFNTDHYYVCQHLHIELDRSLLVLKWKKNDIFNESICYLDNTINQQPFTKKMLDYGLTIRKGISQQIMISHIRKLIQNETKYQEILHDNDIIITMK